MRAIALAAVLFLLAVSAGWGSAAAGSGSPTLTGGGYANKGPTGKTGSTGPNGPASHVKTRWRATLAKLPANAATSPTFVSISSISCASRGNCTAVGSYYDKAGDWQGLLLTEKAGRWARGVEAVLPANAYSDPQVDLTAVSCVSAGNCTAVGTFGRSSEDPYSEGRRSGLLLTERAGHWARGVEAALPAGAGSDRFVTLHSVSCASAGNCTAVGNYGASDTDYNGSKGLLLTEKTGHWKRGVARGGKGADIKSVSCSSDGSCSAVGYFDHYFYSGRNSAIDTGYALLLTKKEGTWRRVDVAWPADGPGESAVLTSVSCTSAGHCSAAGSSHIGIDEGRGALGVLLTGKAGTWRRGVTAKPPWNAQAPYKYWENYVYPAGISCASPGNCVAMGAYYYKSSKQLTLLTQEAGRWRRGFGAAVWRGPQSPEGAAISCASPGSCTVVGSYMDAEGIRYYGFLLTEISGRLGTVVKAPHSIVSVSSVSCASPGNCVAVGDGYLLESTTDPCFVPRLKGETLPSARHRIESHNCFVGTIAHVRSGTIERGQVISQTPRPGRHLVPGTKVNLKVSSGP